MTPHVGLRSSQVSLKRLKIVAPFLLGGLLASGAVLYGLAEFHEEISETWLRNMDRNVMELMHVHTSQTMTVIMFALTVIGSIQTVVLGVSLIALWLWHRDRKGEALLLILAVGGSAAMNVGLKLYFHRHRPDVAWALVRESSFSFPSGHSVAAISLYGILAYLLMNWAKSATARGAVLGTMILLVLGIGLSRIYLGVHYPSDVAAGYLAGLIWLLTIIGSDLMSRRYRVHP
jgi:undecaprenyl-diphosphatase